MRFLSLKSRLWRFQPRKKATLGKNAGKPVVGDLPTTWFFRVVFGHEDNDRRGDILYDIRIV